MSEVRRNRVYEVTVIESYIKDKDGVFQPDPDVEVVVHDEFHWEDTEGNNVQEPEKVVQSEYSLEAVKWKNQTK